MKSSLLDQIYMVFDVESIGLHGEGFAVAWVVIHGDGRTITEACYSCDPGLARGDDEGRSWVAANVTLPPLGRLRSPREIRDEFWRSWLYAREIKEVLVADCAWPVEARFLAACVDDDPEVRRWQGPYPLHDLVSIRLAAGLDPLTTAGRLPEELPEHNPLCDARQSARLLVEALNILSARADLSSSEPS
jgi:hypothetical protein